MKKSKKEKSSVRQKAVRRTAAGRFNKAVFKEIGGKECPRYAALDLKGTRQSSLQISGSESSLRAPHRLHPLKESIELGMCPMAVA